MPHISVCRHIRSPDKMISTINVVVHMQLFWRSSKIYHNIDSNIVQLEEYVVCYKGFQTYLILNGSKG